MEYRKVKFYVLNGRNKDKIFKTKEEIKEFFDAIYDSGELTDDGFVYKTFEVDKKTYTFEFIEYSDEDAFFRIRQPRPKNHYGKSENGNATLKELDIDDNEHMESFTFLYIDFGTDIVSHLKISGTPPISVFVKFLRNESGYGNGITYDCDSIATDDIIKQIINHQKFGTISFSYVNPSDKALSEIPGVTDSVKRKFRANRSVIDVRIVPDKSKSLLKEGHALYEIKKWLLDKYGDNLKRYTVNSGEFEDSKMTAFNLLNQEFTQETNIKTDDEVTAEEYMKAIKKAYIETKGTLVKYIRGDN